VLGATFTISGSHLATDPVERPAQAARWKAELVGIEGPVIVAGDLNEGPGGGAWRTVADGLRTTESTVLTFPATLPQIQLDSVFVTPDISVESYAVVDTDQARRASDHLPVVADLLLPTS
jgi:endonuclease/exonuclease/phosphatase family metal-dependent hydrolase